MRYSFLLAALALAGGPARAEEIRGTLFDRTGAVIPGARVMLMDQDYVKLAETKSGGAGEFTFAGLRPALYFVQAKQPRFHLAQQHIDLKAGETGRAHLVAPVGTAEDVIAINGERAEPADPATVRKPEQRPGGKFEGPQLASGRPPGIPEAARGRGAEGMVVLFATVRADGTLVDAITLDSPDPDLAEASREAFAKWRYRPARLDGQPVDANVMVKFEFRYR